MQLAIKYCNEFVSHNIDNVAEFLRQFAAQQNDIVVQNQLLGYAIDIVKRPEYLQVQP